MTSHTLYNNFALVATEIELEAAARLLVNPVAQFLMYASAERVAGALRVLTLNRSVFDYELIDPADDNTYRLEVFVEEGSLHIRAQNTFISSAPNDADGDESPTQQEPTPSQSQDNA